MTESDRVTQALDDFLKAAERWYHAYNNETQEDFRIQSMYLIAAYAAWLDASKPPGDPHKEWVDAERIKPNPVFVKYVLVKSRYSHGVAVGRFANDKWKVYPADSSSYDCIEAVTHWRYIPEMED